MDTKQKKAKEDWSGYCRHSGLHRHCHWEYETPNWILICGCPCHYPDEAPTPKKKKTTRRKK